MTKVTRLTLDQGGGLERRRIHLREISGDADSPLETVGQDLRAARLRRGDDLATVSRALKIRKDHLEALEEDRLEALPGRTYAIGFVRSYADYLGLDGVQLVERCKAEIAGRDDHPQPVPFATSDEERRLPHGWVIIGIVLLGLVIFGAYRLAISADTMLTQPDMSGPTPPPKPTATVRNVPAKRPAVQTAATPGQTVPGLSGASGTVANGPETTTPQSTPPTSENTAQASPVQLAALPPGQVYGEQNRDSRVLLRVHQATKVLVEGNDGMIYINRVLKPGDSYLVPNRVGLTLSTPNGGAVEVQLDGQSLGYAGNPNESTDAMSLDPQDIMDRLGGSHE